MRALVFLLAVLLTLGAARAEEPPALKVSKNGRFLVTADGRPFFWLGDTAWRLQLLPPDDLAFYLDARRSQGFNVIQGPVLTRDSADYRGVSNDDPAHPNETFLQHIDRIVDETARRGLYSALVVTWGHEFGALGGAEGARRYGAWLGTRYRERTNVIWIVSGEYAIDRHDDATNAIWRALGEGLRAGSRGRQLITMHGSWAPPPLQTSSTYFHADRFLDFNMIQSGQGGNNGDGAASWRLVGADYRRQPAKPVIDGEATYERPANAEHPVWNAAGVRRRAYWSVFGGAFGHTYGADVIPWFQEGWRQALGRDGATTLIHLRRLMESRPMLGRIPDDTLVEPPPGETTRCRPGPIPCGVPDHIEATRDAAGRYAMIYISGGGRPVTVDASRLASQLVAWWFDPATGTARRIGTYRSTRDLRFTTPPGSDWVLVLDDAARKYPPPGRASR
jgi:hypothetical protein